MKSSFIIAGAVLCSIITIRANESNGSGANAGLGKPARFGVFENGKKVVYSAELVQLQRIGQYSWIKKKLPSPRTVYQFRTTRQREDQEIEQIGPAFWSETALQPSAEPPECRDVPWTPSIIVDHGVVWVLFTRYVYDHLGVPFKLYFFSANEVGRSPDKEDVISNEKQHKAPDFSRNVSPYIIVKLEDSREEECFDSHRGAFKLKQIENGELILSAPVLLNEFNQKVKRRLESGYDDDYANAMIHHEKNPEESPAPVHYKELMKDKELLLRYHIENKRWKLDIPEGYKRRGTL